jgi:hypothetical protein
MTQMILPTVIDKGEWPETGARMYNVVLDDGREASIVLQPGHCLEDKVRETLSKFGTPVAYLSVAAKGTVCDRRRLQEPRKSIGRQNANAAWPQA